jgi:hypothetical protein
VKEIAMRHAVSPEDSRRVLIFTVVLWGAGVAIAGYEGIFVKLSTATFGALILFVSVFAAASYALDRGLRELAASAGPRILLLAALAADGILLAPVIALQRSDLPWLENLARFPFAIAALYVAPLAAALHLAAGTRRVRRAPARSPGANPAAT